MSTSQDQEHGFLEDQHIVQSPVSPVLQTYLSPSSTRSCEVGQRRQYLRSPMISIVRCPGFRLYLSPSFARPTDTRQRVSPSIPASAHTSVDIAAGAHTSVGIPRKSGKRKLTSDIWEDFNAIYDEEGRLMQGQCIHCDNIFPSTKKSGSSQCRRHRLVCTEKAKLDELIGSMQPRDARIRALKRFKYDKEIACYELVRMIVLHELPFRIVEYEGFRRFVASLNPAFKLMSRTTIKQDCMAEFDRQKVELLEVLKNLPSRVSLTADNKWKLHKRIIKFASVECPHNATNLLNVMLNTMQEWGIEDKICCITLDNAVVNDLMVSYVKSNLSGRKLLVGNGDIFHQRCGAHVLNLFVQEGLKFDCGAVDAIRESAKFVRSSVQRMESFGKIVAQLGITCGTKVSLDVCTRWNSTYLMMKTASQYITAFDQLAVQDSSFNCAPSASQWKVVDEICKLLVVFYDATVVLSGSLYPTSNAYFKVLWQVKWMLEREALSENATIRLMVAQMKKKFFKYWKLSYLTICIPIILDPRCKVEFLNHMLKEEITIEGPRCLSIVKKKFKEMFNAYSSQQTSDSDNLIEQHTQTSSMQDRWASWSHHVGEQQRQQAKKNKLDMYLKDGLVSPDANIDILEWWMTNSQKYPTISRMARDILDVPALTVASESAFSTGSRVISDYRSRLNSETVNGLICLQDWMRPLGVIDVASIVEDLNNDDEMLGAGPYFRVERNETQVEP